MIFDIYIQLKLSVSHMGDKSHGHESDVSQIPVSDRTRVQQTTKKDDSYDAPILLPPGDISGKTSY
jgi:hypothetical protein